MGVQLSITSYPFPVGVVLIHQLLDHPGSALVRRSVTFQRSEQHEQIAHPVALVLVIDAGSPRPGRTRQPGLPDFVVPILAMVDFSTSSSAHELGAALGRDAPAFLHKA